MDGSRVALLPRFRFQFPLASRTPRIFRFSPPPLHLRRLFFLAIWLVLFPTFRTKSSLFLCSRSVPSLAHCQGYDGFRLRFCDFFVCVFSETFLLFFWGFSRRVSFTNERRLCGLFQRKRRHTTKREHNSTLTEAEERRGQPRNFLRAFIYRAAQPSRPLPAK